MVLRNIESPGRCQNATSQFPQIGEHGRSSVLFARCHRVHGRLLASPSPISHRRPRQSKFRAVWSFGNLCQPHALRGTEGRAIRVSHRDPGQKLRLALAVQPPHMAEEEQFIKELETRGSPNFHQFLTAEEWNARFAPSAEDEQKIVDWAQSQGLTVTNRFANRLLVDVEAPVGVIEKAFGVTINNYQVGDEVDFANDRDPVLPSSVANVVYAVLGLNSIDRVHGTSPANKHIKGPDYVPGPVYAAGESSHGDGDPTKRVSKQRALSSDRSAASPEFTNNYADPGDIFSSQAYNWDGLQVYSHCCNVHNDSGGSPKETSIALATFAGFNGTDVSTFFGLYGFAWNYTVFTIDGTSGTPGVECSPPATGCASVAVDDETTLDTEYSTAAANSYGSYLDTAHVYIYEGANQLYNTYADMYNFMLNDEHARVMSTSWGGAEATSGNNLTYWEDADHAVFNNMVGVGWTLIAASGDQGSTADCATISVEYPASDNDLVAAGGTALMLYSDGTWDYEDAWTGGTGSTSCAKNNGGGTGGVSKVFSQPSWQSSLSSLGSMRLVPDISLNAGGIGENYYYNGKLSAVGGTSIVAPELAGFFAQENTYLNYIGNICGSAGTSACTPVGNPNPFMYEDAIDGAPHNPFYDITSGCTSNNITVANSLTAWCAGTGYDLATGWGSANMLQLAWGINWELIPAYGNPSLAFSGPATSTWYNTDQEVSWTLSDAGSGGYPAPGVAGFTQGWDSIPADPQSEPHGGSGNSFYSGPQFAFATGGCLSFNGLNGCTGGSGQGCHTVQVEGWDNQGRTTFGSYGPLCYDTAAPTITVSNSPATPASGWWDTSVVVTLNATDPGGSGASGIYKTYYAINTGTCYPGSVSTCNIYTGPFTVSGQQQSYIYYFTEDKADNFSTEPYEWVSIDLTPPVTTASLSGTLVGADYVPSVQVTLSASDTGGSGVAHTYYQLDGGSTITYSGSPFTVAAGGSHSVKYWSVDGAGNIETAHTKTFTVAIPATLTTPTPGSTFTGSSVAFTWTAGSAITAYELQLGTTGVGSSNLYNSGSTAATTETVSLPTYGVTVYARLLWEISGVWQHADYTYTESGSTVAPVLTTPAPGSALSGTTVTFTWTAGGGPAAYQLWLGTTGVGSSNLYNSGSTTGTTETVSGLPANGATLYARLYWEIDAAWHSADYTYTEAPSSAPPALVTPAPGSVLKGSSVAFTWTASVGVTEYQLWLGTTGVGSSNLYDSGSTKAFTTTVTGLPTNGVTMYARLYWEIAGAWKSADYTYTESGTPVAPVLTTPAPGSVLSGSSVAFTWTAGAGPAAYQLWLGTTGVGSKNLYNSGSTTGTTETVSGLPTYGVKLYARLYWEINAVWKSADYTYTEAGTPVLAALTSPTPGSVLAGSSVTFAWSAGGGPTEYQLDLGTTGAGSSNLYNSGGTTATTEAVSGLPTGGVTVFARLYSLISGKWQPADYTYTEAGTLVPAALTTPTPGSTLAGSTVTFTWTAGAGPTEYQLELGTTGVGSSNLYNSGGTTATTETVSGLPTTGVKVYARLYQMIDAKWQSTDYTYTAYTVP